MDSQAVPGHPAPAGDQARLPRRSALLAAAAAGLAAGPLAGAARGVIPLAAGPARAASPVPATAAGPDGPLVAHIRNARTGEIDIFHGTTQVRVHDVALAALLTRAGTSPS